MAALTHTVDEVSSSGDHAVITGTITVPNTSLTHVALLPTTGYIFSVIVQTLQEDATTVLVGENLNSDSDQVNGSFSVKKAQSGTLYYTAHVVGGF